MKLETYRSRAYCLLSVGPWKGASRCIHASCDRYVTEAVEQGAHRKGLPIDLHDLKTSKCGYRPDHLEPLEAA